MLQGIRSKNAKEMIIKTNLILSKAKLVSQAETIHLKEMTTEIIQIQHSGAEKRTALD